MGSLFTDAFGAGWGLGDRINNSIMDGRQRRAGGALSQMLRGGDFSGASGLLAETGQTGAALSAAQVPLRQQRADQQQEFAQQQFLATQGQQQFSNQMQQERLRLAREAAERAEREANKFNVPDGYIPIDPTDPNAGVKPIPGLPTYEPSPRSTLGKIQADFEAGLIDQETRDAAIAKATEGRNGITVNPDGTVQIGGSNKPATEGQAKANIYAQRGERSNAILDRLENQGTELAQSLMSGVPLAGNYLTTPAYKQYEQAQRDFINATLRQESGAVISDAEFANARKQYFPQPGDDPQTIAQKKANRQIAMQSIREASGPFANRNQRAVEPAPVVNVPNQNNAGQTPQSAIPVSSESELDDSMVGKYVIVNGQTFKVEAD